jgi:hypothetical protein
MLNLSSSNGNNTGHLQGRFVILLFNIILSLPNLSASDRDFSITSIPQQLLENSKAVVRYHETTLEIQSIDKVVLKVSYAITIVNESGLDNAILNQYYDKFSHINSIHGIVYDRNGEKIERIERDNILDVSAISGFSTYEDNRMIYIEPQYRTVPFTVEYSFEIVYTGILDYPDYYLINDFNIAVEQANLMITAPDSIGLRYLERNIGTHCKVEKIKTGTGYSWTFNNVLPMRYEPFSPPISEYIPSVLIAPNSFKIKKRTGNAESWESFGLWMYELTEGRTALSAETQEKVIKMTSGTNDVIEKIDILYTYFQEKTRYASIQIGLGGWQPFEAETVDRLSYGDCKALTNYLQALLKIAGITSHYTLVKAGEYASDIVRDFPSNQFNHAILCVPLPDDTLWIECTNQHIPLGYLGTFTDDRTILVIKETGGFLGHTAVYDQHDNVQNRITHIQLSPDGSGTVHMTTDYKGIYYDDLLQVLLSDDTDKKKKIEEGIHAGNFRLETFNLKENKAIVPDIEERLNLTMQKIGVMAGDLMLVVPNQMTKQEPFPSQIAKRTNPIRIRRSIIEIDTAYFTLPDGFTLSGNHLNETIISRFGEYHAITTISDGMVQYVRSIAVFKGTYPRDSYSDFIDFFEKVAYTDNKKLALKTMK